MKYLFIIFLSITFLNSCGEKIDLEDIKYSDFKMDVFEVTANEFNLCVMSGSCIRRNYENNADSDNCNLNKIGYENHPMNCVNWFGADEYCKWKGKRLPTEDEWVYFAKGGENYKYAGSNNPNEVAWYSANSGNTTHKVGTKAPNGYGLYDMSGNVCEWTNSFYNSLNHILYGGDFDNSVSSIQTDSGFLLNPTGISLDVGFRCIQEE